MAIPTGTPWPHAAADGTIARPKFTDLYPVATADMTTDDLVAEATQIERSHDDLLDLTEGATFAAFRYRYIRGELYRRGVI